MKVQLPPWAMKVGKWVGYPVFFLFWFVMFAYWTFPYERVRDYIVQEVEAPLGPGDRRDPSGYQLEIVDLSPSWFTGVDATGVRVIKLPENDEERPMDVTFESLSARIGLFALLTGSTSISYEARVAGGVIEGEYEGDETSDHIVAHIESVETRRVGLLRSYLPLPLAGRIAGDVDVTLADEPADTNGEIDIRIEGARLGDANSKLKISGMGDGLSIDPINAGNIAARATVTEGVATITRLQGRGEDLELDGDGEVTLRRPMRSSQIEINFRAKFTDAYKERSERIRVLLELLQLTRSAAALTPDGALQYRIGGALGGRITTTAAGRAPAPGQGRPATNR